MSSCKYPSVESQMEKMADDIIIGNYKLESSFEEIMNAGLFEGNVNDHLGKTNFELLSIVEKCFPFEDICLNLPPLDDVLLKNETIMCLMEDRVDKFYASQDLETSLRCCHLALMFAPETFQTRIYIRRATLLIALGEIDSALKNVDIVLSENISEELRQELLELRIQAETLIGPKKNITDIGQLQSFYEEKVAKVFGQKSDGKTLSVADCVSVEWNEHKERHYITKEDLEPGTTVIVDSAYVKLVTNHMSWQTKYCNTCLKSTRCPIPCKICVFAIYCCEACRLKDWNENGHVYECPLLPYLNAVKISRNMHLALKTVCKAGPETLLNFCEFEKFKSELPESTNSTPNCSKNLIPTDIYSHIASLKCHVRNSTLRFTVWIAISLSKLLRFKTTYFNNQRSEMEHYVAMMLIQHAEVFGVNTLAICAADVETTNKESGDRYLCIASGVFPFISIMSHSCAPTTFRQTLPNGQIAIIINQKLKLGNEISLSYGLNFKTDHILDRKPYLWQHYYFNCSCVACLEKWPTLNDIQSSITFRCPTCNDEDYGLSRSLPFLYEYKNNLGKCGNCKNLVDLNLLKVEADKYKYSLTLANDYLINNEPLKAIPLFVDCIKYYQMKICQPSLQLIFAQSRLGECFDFIVNKDKNLEICANEKSTRHQPCNIL